MATDGETEFLPSSPPSMDGMASSGPKERRPANDGMLLDWGANTTEEMVLALDAASLIA